MFYRCLAVLIQHVKMYTKWYMMWYLKKDMFCKEHNLFGWFIIFKMVCPASVIFVGLAVVHHPANTFHVEVVHAFHTCFCVLCMHASSWDCMCNGICNWAHNCTHDLFGRSRVRTPDLAVQSYLWVQGLVPWPWLSVFRPSVSLAYVTHPHKWSSRWHRKQKTLNRGKKTCLYD